MRQGPSYWAKLRARVDDGKVRVGTEEHCSLIDFDMAIGGLPRGSQRIVRLALKGWSHQLIADHLGIERGRVNAIVRTFEASIKEGL